LKQSFKTRLMQMWVPAEFRLPVPEFTAEQLDLLEELIQLMSPNFSGRDETIDETVKVESLKMAHFLTELGTGIWRVRRKMEGLSKMPKEMEDALRSIESIWMSMSDGGVEVIDHIGVMPSKNEARIIEVRDTPGLAREQVIDAVKPTILIHGEVAQRGEVVVGRPAPGQYAAATPQPDARQDEDGTETGNEERPSAAEPDNVPDESAQSLGAEPEPDENPSSDIPPETNERFDAENPAAETALAEDTGAQDDAAADIPLPQKRARGKSVLPASVKSELAAIPEIRETSPRKKPEEKKGQRLRNEGENAPPQRKTEKPKPAAARRATAA
jgi:hypothetical protein